MIEQGLLVFEQPVVTAIQLVDFGQPEVFAEQIGHGTALKPFAMQPPLAARRQQPVGRQQQQHPVPPRALRLGGSRPPQKRSSSSSRHKLSANQHPPHWRGRHNRSSFSRNRTIEASGSNPSQRSSGNSDSVRGCSAPSSTMAIDLRQASSCESLISPRYSSGRCTTRPPPIRRFSTMLQ